MTGQKYFELNFLCRTFRSTAAACRKALCFCRAQSPGLPELSKASLPPFTEQDMELQQQWRPTQEETNILTLPCAPLWGVPPDNVFFTEAAFAQYSVSARKVGNNQSDQLDSFGVPSVLQCLPCLLRLGLTNTLVRSLHCAAGKFGRDRDASVLLCCRHESDMCQVLSFRPPSPLAEEDFFPVHCWDVKR